MKSFSNWINKYPEEMSDLEWFIRSWIIPSIIVFGIGFLIGLLF